MPDRLPCSDSQIRLHELEDNLAFVEQLLGSRHSDVAALPRNLEVVATGRRR